MINSKEFLNITKIPILWHHLWSSGNCWQRNHCSLCLIMPFLSSWYIDRDGLDHHLSWSEYHTLQLNWCLPDGSWILEQSTKWYTPRWPSEHELDSRLVPKKSLSMTHWIFHSLAGKIYWDIRDLRVSNPGRYLTDDGWRGILTNPFTLTRRCSRVQIFFYNARKTYHD